MIIRTAKEFYAWTVFAVLAVGTFEVLTALTPPTAVNKLYQSRAYAKTHPLPVVASSNYSVSTTETVPEKDPARDPASLSPAEKKAAFLATQASAVANEAVELSLPCQGTLKTTFPENVVQVRLIGEACGKKTLSSAEIQNLDNKFSATVFTTPPRAYTTDYISLRTGTNHISISLHFKDQSVETRELVIEHVSKNVAQAR